MEKYRKIPLHNFVARQLENYVAKINRKPDDFIFGWETDKKVRNTNPLKAKKALLYILTAFEIRKRFKEKIKTNVNNKKPSFQNIQETVTFTKEDRDQIEEYSVKNNYHFYSFRHTLTTILGLEKLNPDFIDYITGHLPRGVMRGNYTHINSVDTPLFCREYGQILLKVIDKYFFKGLTTSGKAKTSQQKKENDEYMEKTFEKFLENKRKEEERRRLELGEQEDIRNKNNIEKGVNKRGTIFEIID
jgi:hypothetical protein